MSLSQHHDGGRWCPLLRRALGQAVKSPPVLAAQHGCRRRCALAARARAAALGRLPPHAERTGSRGARPPLATLSVGARASGAAGGLSRVIHLQLVEARLAAVSTTRLS